MLTDVLRPGPFTLTLIGGGWDAAAAPALYGPFLESAGPTPVIACVVFDEGDGQEQFERWGTVLRAVAPCEPVPVLLTEPLAVERLGTADGLLVCGGLTPAYADALAPAAAGIREWLTAGRPYAGFSAGSAVAPADAVVGGWLVDGVPVCSDDAGEDLDEVLVRPGLGLVGAAVDVHCAQWGTLPRLLAAVGRTGAGTGIGLDENTAVHVREGEVALAGLGSAHLVRAGADGNATYTRLTPRK